jgi:hypothetical protein
MSSEQERCDRHAECRDLERRTRDTMRMSPAAHPHLAPGSVVVVRDEEWFVRATEETTDGLLVHVQGLGELVRDTTASFYASLDKITPLDPARARSSPTTAPGTAPRASDWSRQFGRPPSHSATVR